MLSLISRYISAFDFLHKELPRQFIPRSRSPMDTENTPLILRAAMKQAAIAVDRIIPENVDGLW